MSSTSTWCRPATPGQYLSDGQTITKSTVPSEVGPALDAANSGLAVLPKEKIDSLLTETSQAVGGLGPGAAAPGRLDDEPSPSDFKDNLPQVNDIIDELDADPGQPGRLG